jgi:hypothetical protein
MDKNKIKTITISFFGWIFANLTAYFVTRTSSTIICPEQPATNTSIMPSECWGISGGFPIKHELTPTLAWSSLIINLVFWSIITAMIAYFYTILRKRATKGPKVKNSSPD